MKKRYIGLAGLGLVLALGTQQVHAQQGFGTDKPAKSAAVDIQSSKRGLLIPRVNLVSTTDGTTPINGPEQSLMVYNLATTKGENGVTPGYYYWDTNRWVRFAQQGDITAINLGGDVTGPINATVVGAIQGTPVSGENPAANQVLMFEDGEWKPVTPPVHENIYTHDGTLVNPSEGSKQRKVAFGEFDSMFFNKNGEGHDFTFDNRGHVGLNMYGKNISSIGLIVNEEANERPSTLKIIHTKDLAEITVNSNEGLKISTENVKNIDFSTFNWATGSAVEKKIMTLKADGGVQVHNINKPEFKGTKTDKVVVADATGVLKTTTAAMPKVFYMPPVMFNTAATGTEKTRNLYQEYVAMYGGTGTVVDMPNRPALVKNTEAENTTIPVFGVKELDFYVSYYDPEVFENVTVDNNGVLTYDVKKKAKYGSFMTIVFVVRDTPRQ